VNPQVPKATQLRLQAASDRALAEQLAVVRCLREARSCLQQWVVHASTAGPTLRALGKKFKHTVESAAKELDSRSAALMQVSSALDAAERARVPPLRATGGHNDESSMSVAGGVDGTGSVSSRHSTTTRAALVCPLESLARGVAGKEVAALILALRTYSTELESSALDVRQLGTRLAAELRRELEGLSVTEANIEYAAEETASEVLNAPLPGSSRKSGAAGAVVGGKAGAGSGKRVSAASVQLSGKGSEKASGDIATRPPFDLSLS
jgi:hypothetical protein